MKISAMTLLTGGENSDVFPVVRNSTNYKMNLGTLMSFIISRLGSKIGGLAGIGWNSADEGDTLALNHDGETRSFTLDNISNWIINKVLRPRWCSGTFNCNGASEITVTFPRELASVPIVVCTPVGNTDSNIYSIKVKPNLTTTTGFSVLVLQQHNETTSRSDSPSLVVNYIAMCQS